MRIKKISPTTPANGNIENQYGTSQTNAYSEAYANTTFATKDVATTSANGLMTSTDKTRLNNYADGVISTPLTTNFTTSFNNQENGTTKTYRFQNGATDAPSSTVGGILISFRDTADWGWQIAEYNNVTARREKRQGTWGSWVSNPYVDTGWIIFTNLANFTNFSWEPIAYRKIGKVVYIHGGGTVGEYSNTTISTLPDGFRPRQNIDVPCATNNSYATVRLHIGFDGSIYLDGPTNANVKEVLLNTCFVAR